MGRLRAGEHGQGGIWEAGGVIGGDSLKKIEMCRVHSFKLARLGRKGNEVSLVGFYLSLRTPGVGKQRL